MLPRLESTGETTRLFVEQAFGRITPLPNAELAISVGKFDSVFGIEYLENQANFRIGVTPSLLARYTTGTSVGVKAFYRYQIIPIASAVSLNAAATNSGTFIEALQGSSRSLTGVPVATARLGYELNLAQLSVKVGGSVSYGPRNDQNDREAHQLLWGADLRVYFAGLSVWGEFVHVDEAGRQRAQADRHRDVHVRERVFRAGVLAPGRVSVAVHPGAVQADALCPLRTAAGPVRRYVEDRGRSGHSRAQPRPGRKSAGQSRISDQSGTRRCTNRSK